MAMMVKDDWVRAAITDDNVVVELLVSLKQAQVSTPSAPRSALTALKWGIRQPRSRPTMSSIRFDAKSDGDFNVSARGSPTTPLCWSVGSGDASPSSATEGFEETSTHIRRSPPSRSKGSGSSESNRTSSKRSRRRKTFVQLKEEENLLLKERVHLKKEIASTRATCKEHRSKNVNLKRIRLDWNSNAAKNSSLIADQPQKVPCLRVASSFDSTSQSESLDNVHKSSLDSYNVGKAICSEKSLFVLPDLNMTPAEDASGPQVLRFLRMKMIFRNW